MFKNLALIVLVFLFPFTTVAAFSVTEQQLLDAASDGNDWLMHGRDYAETRYSPLDQVSRENAAALGLAWHLDLDDRHGLQATPLAKDGILYFTGNWSVLYAVDASNGRELWRYDPQIDRRRSISFCCGVVNRGAALWADKLYIGTLDGDLVAVNALSGEEVWRSPTIDKAKHYSITGAPRVANGVVIIGNGGSEFGTRGYVSGYDAESGEMLWRFWTVPGNPADGFENELMAMAAKTWSGEWWTMGGGGTVWDSLAYDPELDLLYVGVGNGAPHNRDMRSPGGGDNLFLSSIVAVRPKTGEYVWHYQETPAESWDYTATQHMILTDIFWQGEMRKVLLQAPKNGFFFILDRETGELLSAEPYVPVNWASHYDMSTGRPVETPNADYMDEPFMLRPSGIGGHNWQPMAYSPRTGLVYLPAQNFAAPMEKTPVYEFIDRHWNLGYEMAVSPFGYSLTQAILRKSTEGYLLAWDPITQREVWRAPNRSLGNGGVLATAGDVVFQGGTDNQFSAYDARSGDKLWSFDTQQGIMAAPITYTVDGEQYVTILVGRGGGIINMLGLDTLPSTSIRRVLTFKIDGADTLPPIIEQTWEKPPPVPADISAEEIERGAHLYQRFCARCHGASAVSGGSVPDLRRLDSHWYVQFDDVVRGGLMESSGMPRFDDVLSEQDALAVKAYVLREAQQDWAVNQDPAWWHTPLRWLHQIFASLLVMLM
ncbi:MAG: PQQ-dependent dehydrogenase, methanol/ethanol family [Pseudomonadales bacterium]